MIQPLLIPQGTKEKRIDTDFYVEGYATTFDKPYLLYEYDGQKYFERIDRNALVGADMSDVIMQYDHSGKVLARLSNKTLGVEVTESGLFTFADLSKSRAAQDMFEEIKNGLITKMSWAFRVTEDSYDRDTRTRTILKVAKVYDVSAVSIPANGDTEISARSYFDGVIEREQQERLERRKQILKIKLKKLSAAGYSDAFITASSGTVAPSAPAAAKITEGSRVRLKQGAPTYTGGSLASYVYDRVHVVKEISGKRAVITFGNIVVAAVNVDDLTLA